MPQNEFGGGKLKADLNRWKQIKGLEQKSDVYALLLLLMIYLELRSVFYWRIGKLSSSFSFGCLVEPISISFPILIT